MLLLARNGDDARSKNLGYLDSSASNHICGYKKLFMELNEIVNGEVSFGDASKVQVSDVGKILIKLKDGSQQYVSNIYYVPQNEDNSLLSRLTLRERL